MLEFWLIAMAMVFLAVVIVIAPLWRRQAVADISRDAINTRIFRERLADLDAEHQQGQVDDNQYQQLREELECTLLTDVPEDTGQRSQGSRLTRSIALSSAVIAPLFALGYYYIASYRGEAQEWINVQSRLENAVEQAMQRPDALPPEAEEAPLDFTRVLQSRLLADGMQNPDGLYLLGANYLNLQAPQAAVATLRKAHGLAPERPDIALAYAQAMMITNDGRLTQDSAHLIARVLKTHPDHQGALMLFGFGAFSTGLYEDAIKAWQRLLALRDPASEGARLLKASIARAEELRVERDRQRAEAPARAAESLPSTFAQITVTVELSPALQQRLAPQDTLFIFARAANGPAMPLAAVRQPVKDFPVQVVLDDSRAMLPSMKLSDFQEVVVGARISKAGEVKAKPGDLQGLSEMLSPAEGPQSVSVIIDQVVQ